MSDADAVRAAQRGDAAAFSALVDRHLGVMYAVALGVLGRPDDAEDAVQDAFLIAYRRIGDCRDAERVRGWLLRIARNRALNIAEYRQVRAHEALHESVPSREPSHDPMQSVERSELRAQLTAALAQLKPVRRSVVLLHDLEELTHSEIAEAIGISEMMSRKHLMNARRELRAILEGTQ